MARPKRAPANSHLKQRRASTETERKRAMRDYPFRLHIEVSFEKSPTHDEIKDILDGCRQYGTTEKATMIEPPQPAKEEDVTYL